MIDDLFDWDGWDQVDSCAYAYYGVKFKRDFGEFRQGEEYASVSLDFADGTIQAWKGEKEKPDKEVEFVISPKT